MQFLKHFLQILQNLPMQNHQCDHRNFVIEWTKTTCIFSHSDNCCLTSMMMIDRHHLLHDSAYSETIHQSIRTLLRVWDRTPNNSLTDGGTYTGLNSTRSVRKSLYNHHFLFSYACILKAHSHSKWKSGAGSIWASLEIVRMVSIYI
jgi:hypothetical protein